MSAWRFGLILRGGLFLTALTMAVLAFAVGVGVSERAAVAEGTVLVHVYYALGLFVLGGLDLGVPVGGPGWARTMLWVSYFAAPVITTSAVLEGAVRLLEPDWLMRRGLRGHVVVVGAGRLGRLFLEALREKDPLRQVLVVDRDVEKADIREMLRRFRASFYPGDIRERGCFDSLGLDRARAVVLITEDDVVNLEAAWRLAEIAPHLVITAHVGDLAMWRTVRSLQDRGGARIHIFNGHRIAARQLYQDHLHDYFESTHPRDVVVIVGFGRFGQTLLEYLQAAAGSQIQRAVIVDLAARRQLRVYRRHVPYSDRFGLVAIEGDTDDPEIWERIEEAVAGVGVDPVYILGTDDDRLNLRAAMVFRREHPQARIFVRAVYESAFTNTVSRQLRFEMLSVESMLRVALAEEQEKWGPAPRPSILPMPAE